MKNRLCVSTIEIMVTYLFWGELRCDVVTCISLFITLVFMYVVIAAVCMRFKFCLLCASVAFV